jgi:hypothetical protein
MYTLEHSLYHSLLRVSALTLACTLLFVSGVLHPITSELTVNTEQYLATTISATAGVAPNEYNQITAALTEQRAALDARAANLEERELAIGIANSNERSWLQGEITTWLNSALLFIILILLCINYTLDLRFRRHLTARTQAP